MVATLLSRLGIMLASGQSMFVYSSHGSALMPPAKIICVVEIEKSKDMRQPYIKQLLVLSLLKSTLRHMHKLMNESNSATAVR